MTLRKLREKSGLSIKQLAFQSGVSRSMVGMIETGDRSPSLEVIRALAYAFGLKTSEVVASLEDEHA